MELKVLGLGLGVGLLGLGCLELLGVEGGADALEEAELLLDRDLVVEIALLITWVGLGVGLGLWLGLGLGLASGQD